MFLRLTHHTCYEYAQPVSFAPHAIYLRPRETSRQRLHQFDLAISPPARRIATRDVFDNDLDWAFFTADGASTRLEFRTEVLVETLNANPFDFFLGPEALTFPPSYNPVERGALAACLTPRPDSPPPAVLRDWVTAHVPAAPAETVPFLTALNGAIHRALTYAPRDEPGIQSAAETMHCRGGSCRDYAVFLIELCRALGLAARFVSGYLYETPVPNTTPPSMHAWTEVYLPGAGWRGMDPTRGIFCDDAFVAVAHAAVAESVSPIQGTFFGPPNVTSSLTTRLSIEKC